MQLDDRHDAHRRVIRPVIVDHPSALSSFVSTFSTAAGHVRDITTSAASASKARTSASSSSSLLSHPDAGLVPATTGFGHAGCMNDNNNNVITATPRDTDEAAYSNYKVHDALAALHITSSGISPHHTDLPADDFRAPLETTNTATRIGSTQASREEAIVWSSYDHLSASTGLRQPILVTLSDSGRLTIWDMQTLPHKLTELYNSGPQSPLDHNLHGSIVVARVVPRAQHRESAHNMHRSNIASGPHPHPTWLDCYPCLVFLTRNANIVFFDIARNAVIHAVSLRYIAPSLNLPKEMLVNKRIIAVTSSQPAEIHLFDIATLSPLSVSPKTFGDAPHPVIALSSNRFLAFATAQSTLGRDSGVAAGPSENFGDGLSPLYEAQESRSHGFPTTSIPVSTHHRSNFSVQGARRLSETFISSAAKSAATRRLLSNSAPSTAEGDSARPQQASVSKSSVPLNHVQIIDLCTLRTVCHFRPYPDKSVLLLSFSPDGRQLLTSCTDGQAFHVFELRLPNPSQTPNRYCAWHRYRLTRGLTIARTVGAVWSADGRFVAVSTQKGTTHVFAISPSGGKPNIISHTNQFITNIDAHQPLSETLASIAKLHPWRNAQMARPENEASGGNSAQSFPPPSDTVAAAVLFPSYTDYVPLLTHGTDSPSRNTSVGKLHANITVYYAHSQQIQLARVTLGEYVPSLSRKVASASTRVAMSGLSQMLLGQTAKSTLNTASAEVQPELSATVLDLAYYRLNVASDDGQWNHSVALVPIETDSDSDSRAHPTVADIHTHSYAAAVATRSIYLSPAYNFYTYPPKHSVQPAFLKGGYDPALTKRIRVRDEVGHTHRIPLDEGQEGDELRDAMHSGIDSAKLYDAQDNCAYSPPAYPNGYGRPSLSSSTRHWRDVRSLASGLRSIPIPAAAVRTASSALVRSFEGVRSLSGIHSSPANDLASLNGGRDVSVALSFEADDAVFPTVHDYPRCPQLDADPVILAPSRWRTPMISRDTPAPLKVADGTIEIPQAPRAISQAQSLSGGMSVRSTGLPSVSSAGHSIPGMTHGSNSDSPLSMPLTTPEVSLGDDDAVQLIVTDNVEVEDEWAAWKLDGIDDTPESGNAIEHNSASANKHSDADRAKLSCFTAEMLIPPPSLEAASLGTSPVSLSSSPASVGNRKSTKKKAKSKR